MVEAKRTLDHQPTQAESSQEETPEVLTFKEQLERIVSWTIPLVDVEALVKPNGTEAALLEKDEWTPILAGVARIRADSQNDEGIRIGYYPEGFIVNGVYTYDVPAGKKKRAPKYTPRPFGNEVKQVRELFPRTEGVKRFARLIEDESVLGRPEVDSAIEWARIGYRLYMNEVFRGNRWIEVRSGIPILVFSDQEDLMRLKPFRNISLPAQTQAVSYIAPDEKGGRGTPIIAKHESALEPDIDQHVKTLLMFAQTVDPMTATPILVTRFTPTLEDFLKLKIKERVLTLYIREKGSLPADWHRSLQMSQAIEGAVSELFIKRRRLGEPSPLYIDNRKDIRTTYGVHYQRRISDWAKDEMIEQVFALGSVAPVIEAREITLDKLNFFGLLPDWREAAKLLNGWAESAEHRQTFGIPYKRSSDGKTRLPSLEDAVLAHSDPDPETQEPVNQNPSE